jgi:hypothetical protein
MPSGAGQQRRSHTRATSAPRTPPLTAGLSHRATAQTSLGNQAIARALGHPGNGSLSAIVSNPAAAQALAGNRAVARVLARKKTSDQVKATLNQGEIKSGVLERSEKNYNKSLERGRKLLEEIEANATRNPQPKTDKSVTKQYAKTLEGFKTDLAFVSDQARRLHTLSQTSATASKYVNQVDLPAQTIVAEDNERFGAQAPPNSEAFWWQYKKVLHVLFPEKARYKEEKRKSLAHIARTVIVNEQTEDTMRWCQGTPTSEPGWFVVHPTEAERDDFCALLGTPNGTAAGYLLIQHGVSFMKKGIASIEYSPAASEMRIHFS